MGTGLRAVIVDPSNRVVAHSAGPLAPETTLGAPALAVAQRVPIMAANKASTGHESEAGRVRVRSVRADRHRQCVMNAEGGWPGAHQGRERAFDAGRPGHADGRTAAALLVSRRLLRIPDHEAAAGKAAGTGAGALPRHGRPVGRDGAPLRAPWGGAGPRPRGG